MEESKEKIILRQLPKLIENTICSTTFLQQFSSCGIFSAEDIENVTTEGKNRGRFAQAAKIYSILTTKTNAFQVLVDALTLTNQSEALSCLNQTQTNAQHEIRKYQVSPAFINEFVLSDLQVLLLISKDCQISGDRIIQTVHHAKLVTLDDLLTPSTAEHCKRNTEQISVLICGANLDRALYYIPTLSEKIILITNKNVDISYIEQSPFSIKHQMHKLKVTEDILQWDDLSEEFQSQISSTLETYMQVEKINLSPVLKNVDVDTLLVLIRGDVPVLLKNTIPKALSYYIQRKFVTRNRITNKIFDNPGDDIFLFTEIEPEVLEQKAKVGQIAKSEDLLSEFYEGDDNFVILQDEKHFQQICDKFNDKSVHLMKNNQLNFIWIKSKGNLSKLHLALERNQLELKEEKFFNEIFPSKFRIPVCISDSPGMGKSVLLAQIARRLQAQSKCLVAFVVINELVQNVKVRMRTEEINEAILKALFIHLRNNSLGEFYLQTNKHFLKEILFDGFDEIDADDVDLGYKCLKVIHDNFTESRIWVTARPHMLLDLENALEVLGYNIAAFQERDQIDFLTLYWSHESIKTGNVKRKDLEILPKNVC